MTMRSKSILAILFFLAVFGVVYHAWPVIAGGSDNLSGWAWSDNIGWLSLNNLNQGDAQNYGVEVGAGGAISGYAWSPNIGFVSFKPSDLTACPATANNPNCSPKLNRATGELSGWARACAGTVNGDCTGASRDDGWDGWVSLKGTSPAYGVHAGLGASCNWSGWAWGGAVVGWIDFSGVTGSGNACAIVAPAPASLNVSCAASPNPALVNEPVTWSASVADGTMPYTYSWSGTDGLSGNTKNVVKSYSTFTPKQATVNVTDSAGAHGSGSCNLTITRLREVQP